MATHHSTPKRTGQAPPPILGRGGPHGPGLTGKKERAKDIRGTLYRLWGYLKRQKWPLIGTFVMVALTSGLRLLGPYLMGVAIDVYIIPGDRPGLARIALLMLGLYVLTSFTTWLQSYMAASVAQLTVRDIRKDIFDKLQTLSLRFFDQHQHGELMSRLTNDVDMINNVLNEGITQLMASVLTVIGVTGAMIWINARLALVSLVTIPLLMTLLSRWTARRTREGFRQQQAALGELNGMIEETITGQRVVKAYVREQAAIEQFQVSNQELRRAGTQAQIFAGFMGPLMNLVNNLGFAIVAGTGGWMVVQGLATVGTIASFVNYMQQFSRPLTQMANLYNTIQAAIAGAERIFETLDEVPDLTDAPDARPLGQIRGEVVFDEVTFAYEADVPVLKQVNLRAEPGQTFALVGPTGAGKTTIVNLLTRFYDIDNGHIYIDGQDIRYLRKDDLRRQLGIVLQDTFLFSGSVMENIRYGRLDATDEEVIAAAKLANADQFIHRLPQGYDTPLSERGSNLSQGQRQLLAIARAILANPSILILDEATSSVDTRTEKNIQEAMLRLMAGRTSFVIAHRLSTIREADQILVINHGEIIERGTHAELLARAGFYYRLYTSQFKGRRAEVLSASETTMARVSASA